MPGDSFWFAADSADQLLVSAGEVSALDWSVTLRFGSTLTGNPHPVAIDVQDITCNDGCSDSVTFSILDSAGLTGDSLQWIDWYEGEDGVEACWTDSDYQKIEGMAITPGMALWVAADSDSQIITFNAPDYDFAK